MTTENWTAQSKVKAERIVLTGFMGSGKSTVGRLLAERLQWAFTDLDTEIERRCGLTVPEIFSFLGEPHFRERETAALAAVLGQGRVVIALGGGAPEAPGNRLLLKQTPSTMIVLLQAPFAVLQERCRQQESVPGTTARPLLADPALAEARYQARQRHYEDISNIRLDTSSFTAQQTVESLLDELRG